MLYSNMKPCRSVQTKFPAPGVRMHPYEKLDERFFWASAVAKRNMFDIAGLWDPKFSIAKHLKVVTFGSCFAQHIGRALSARGYNWLNTEPAPRGLGEENAKKFNYGVFSARTGNIYTVSLLQQWVNWATGDAIAPTELWERDSRYYDPFRPNIEPNGFASEAEMRGSRELAIESFRASIAKANVFVFTLGLTESWFNREYGYEYPMCPGTVAGEFDESKHQFVNQTYPFIHRNLVGVIKKIRKLNPTIKFLLTVSPVPLTATMSGNHVLVATLDSKSVLRAVAGHVAGQFDFVDYFPSYELINATPFRGAFFEPNQRSVSHTGVDHVMNSFFSCLISKFPVPVLPEGVRDNTGDRRNKKGRRPNGITNPNRNSDTVDRTAAPDSGERKLRQSDAVDRTTQDDVVCEEELLSAFAK